MTKEKIFEEVEQMLNWAKDNNHITEDAYEILMNNLDEIKERS